MITILMALRNGIEFLPEAVASVKAQTYSHWQLLIGVNGHPPNSGVYTTALQYQDQGYGITVFDLPSCVGKPQTLNTMLSLSTSLLVAVLDVDDLWEPTKLERQVEAVEGRDVVGTMGRMFGDRDLEIPWAKPGPVTYDMLQKGNCIINSSVLMRRECAGWEEIDCLEDFALWLKLARDGKKLYNMSEVLTRIRIHPGQWFRNNLTTHQSNRRRKPCEHAKH